MNAKARHPLFQTFTILSAILFLSACSSGKKDSDITVSLSPAESVAGVKFASGFAACGFCHSTSPVPGAPLNGGREISIEDLEFTAGSVNPGAWTTEEFIQLFRENVRADGKVLRTKAHAGYEWIADEDLFALVSYLVNRKPGIGRKRGEGAEDSSWLSLPSFRLPEVSRTVRVTGVVPSVPKSRRKSHGAYMLNTVARCQTCHTGVDGFFANGEPYDGGREVRIGGESRTVPSLRDFVAEHGQTGVVEFLSSGESPSGREVSREFCPTAYFQTTPREFQQNLAFALASEIARTSE